MRETAESLEERVGHPGEKWDALKQLVQVRVIRRFSEVQGNWLDLMWTMDAYRAGRIAPRDMGDPTQEESTRLAAIYRGKGNWFATLLTLILENQTTQTLGSRSKVIGFSQTHQVDVAWPDREVDPLVCLETKVTGAGPSGSTKPRGAMADWTNRRKELKFAATDLKLSRRQEQTAIEHWDVWRENEMPKAYFLWAARLQPRDSVTKMVREAQALVKTYLDGAGLIAWRDAGDHYEVEPVPQEERVSDVDNVLYRIASQIRLIAPPGREPPPPVTPKERAVDVGRIQADRSDT